MKKIRAITIMLGLVIVFSTFFLSCSLCRQGINKRPPTLLATDSGNRTTEFQIHDSIMLDAINLAPRTGYEIQIVAEDGTIIKKLGLSSDRFGRIPETVVWYDIGILPCLTRKITHPTVITHLTDNEISDFDFTGKNYSLRIIKDNKLVRESTFRISKIARLPRLYAADSRGCPKTGFLIGEENIWAVGKNFPPGSIIRLWAVLDDSEWKEGDLLKDMSKQYGSQLPPLIELKGAETGFKKLLWPKEYTSIGSYDIIAETVTYPFGAYHATASARVQNVASSLKYSGFVVQRRPGAGEPLEQNIAGVRQSKLAYRDTFLTTENVYAGVDPYVQPAYIGMTAHVYIVQDKTDAQWTTDPSLTDITGYVETVTIQPGTCANAYSTLAWAAPLTKGKYDVVLDFNNDGAYTAGVDLIDSLDSTGFTVADLRVESISFNFTGSSAFDIYDNINGVNITAPEYSCGTCGEIKPAVWIKGGTPTVKVVFKAVPSVNSSKIWAEDGLGGLNSSASPVSVAFSGGSGQATFTVNTNPNYIGKHEFDWKWKCKDINGTPSSPTDMGVTGSHYVYTTYAPPQDPMVVPGIWLEVLEYATDWANGEATEAGVVEKIVKGIYSSGMVYNGFQWHTSGYGTFNLTGLFNELRTTGFTVYMDCRDCANFFHCLTNALGFSHRYLRIPGYFDYKPMLPMGVAWVSGASCVSGGWNFHQVGWCGSHVADASTKLNCTAVITSLVLAICDINAIDYIDLLTATTGITSGSTGICSPY